MSQPVIEGTPDIDIEMDGQGDEEMEQESVEASISTADAANAEQPNAAPTKKKREKKDPVPLVREGGKSLLPFARVQKIIKADKECLALGHPGSN